MACDQGTSCDSLLTLRLIIRHGLRLRILAKSDRYSPSNIQDCSECPKTSKGCRMSTIQNDVERCLQTCAPYFTNKTPESLETCSELKCIVAPVVLVTSILILTTAILCWKRGALRVWNQRRRARNHYSDNAETGRMNSILRAQQNGIDKEIVVSVNQSSAETQPLTTANMSSLGTNFLTTSDRSHVKRDVTVRAKYDGVETHIMMTENHKSDETTPMVATGQSGEKTPPTLVANWSTADTQAQMESNGPHSLPMLKGMQPLAGNENSQKESCRDDDEEFRSFDYTHTGKPVREDNFRGESDKESTIPTKQR